jgi:hypothetical protein
VQDVAHQEEVVRTLVNTLETGNVSPQKCVVPLYSLFFLDGFLINPDWVLKVLSLERKTGKERSHCESKMGAECCSYRIFYSMVLPVLAKPQPHLQLRISYLGKLPCFSC